jgi:hypothetical protein
MSFFGHGYPDDESDEYDKYFYTTEELKMPKNMKRLPKGAVFLMQGDPESEYSITSPVNMHKEIHDENHECGLAGCKKIGYRVPEDFKYGK